MTLVEILVLALALSADAFSVGAALGLRHRSARQTFRLAFHFGLFQALMPLAGALLGTALLRWVEASDHWVAFCLLTLLGLRMIQAASRTEEKHVTVDLTRGLPLVGLSAAVSIDALAAGISLPAVHAPIPLAVSLFGVVAGLATFIAVRLAASIARRVGRSVEVVAGLVLIALGLRILHEHVHFLPWD